MRARKPVAKLPATRVWLRLFSCANVIQRRLRDGLRRQFGTTLPRFDLLAQLDHAESGGTPSLTMSELSERLMVSNGNLTGLVVRLAREGLVRRSASPTDARAQLVSLTAAGRRGFGRMAARVRGSIDLMFAGLSQRERAQLHALVGELKQSVEASHREDGVP